MNMLRVASVGTDVMLARKRVGAHVGSLWVQSD